MPLKLEIGKYLVLQLQTEKCSILISDMLSVNMGGIVLEQGGPCWDSHGDF